MLCSMKKWLKILLIILAVIIAIIALLLVLAAPVAKKYVNNHGTELIGREVHIDRLRLNALGGRVRIYGFTVYEEDAQTPFFEFDTLDVSVKLRRLLAQELHVRHITLAEPRVRIYQDGNRFNFSSIIDHFTANKDTADRDTTPSEWRLGFYNIRLSEGVVYYADRQRHSEWDLKNLNLKVPGVYFDGSENTDAGLALQLADGGVLRTEASLNLDNNDFKVDLELEHFAISNLRAYLGERMQVGRMEGLLDAAIAVRGNLSEIMKMNISGTLGLAHVDVRDRKDVQALACNNLAVEVNRINLDENLFDIRRVAIDGLVSRFDRYNDGNNFTRLFAGNSAATVADEVASELPQAEETTQPDTPPAPAKPMQFSLGSFALTNAQFTYADHTLPDAFEFPVTKLNVTAENVLTGGENKARIMAHLPHGGMAMVNWNGRIDEWKHSQHLALNIRNLQLKDFSPYSVAYLGYPFTDGTVSFSSENNIVYSQLNSQNKLDLFNPEVGDKRKDVDAKVSVPLKAALYILKDKDGKVQFDVPVSGNIDSPEFNYMKIVWKTLGNLIVKVATSPFRAVSKALGLSGELDYIAYDPLQTHFDSEQYSILNKISDVLRYDTNIVVTLEPQIDAEKCYKQQSLYLLKEEYYLSLHPEEAEGDMPPQVRIFDRVNVISLKDTGFVAFVKGKGIKSKRPTDKEVQRLAESLYPKDAAISSLEVLSGYRDGFVRRFFVEQNGITDTQLVVAPLVLDAKRSGYNINSSLREGAAAPELEEAEVDE